MVRYFFRMGSFCKVKNGLWVLLVMCLLWWTDIIFMLPYSFLLCHITSLVFGLFLKPDYVLQREPTCNSLTHSSAHLLTHSLTHLFTHVTYSHTHHTCTHIWIKSTKILQGHLIPDEQWVAHRWLAFSFTYHESVKGLMVLTGSKTQCVFWVTVTLDYQGTWWQKMVGITMKSSHYQWSVITTSSVIMESASIWAW